MIVGVIILTGFCYFRIFGDIKEGVIAGGAESDVYTGKFFR